MQVLELEGVIAKYSFKTTYTAKTAGIALIRSYTAPRSSVELSKIVGPARHQSGVASGRDTKPLAASVTDQLAIVGDDAHFPT